MGLNLWQAMGIQLKKARIPDKQETVVRGINSLGVKMNQSRLSLLETGKGEMRVDELKAFCDYFHVPETYFTQAESLLDKEKRSSA